jgi:hypothetical protein
MVVRLQTAEGKIKEYQTVKGVGDLNGEGSGVDKWITKCGREWDRVPEIHQECSHLECAIDKANIWKLHATAVVLFGLITAISFGIADKIVDKGAPGAILLFAFPFAVITIILLVSALDEKKCWDELNEFKNDGSIKGIKAWQIHEDPHPR